jgi:tetraacyldisaccharide 4'-kinase
VKRLDAYWDSRNGISLLLLPLSWLFLLIAGLRRQAYRWGLLQTHRLPVPVIVVGNITVGGTGKTPLVTWLACHLQGLGLRPGLIARGYGGRVGQMPLEVRPDSSATEIGDEPRLLASRTGCPMFVCSDRVAAARALLESYDCDVIISDDGMQHHALARDMEIAVIDGERRFGNGFCLPAGPLRECPSRLATVDLVVSNGGAAPGEYGMHLRPGLVVNLRDGQLTRQLADFAGQRVHALAGIGNPSRFFRMLREAGLDIDEQPFPDHYRFMAADISPDDELPVLMTEKDAVKCSDFAQERHWYVQADVELADAFGQRLDALLRGIKRG